MVRPTNNRPASVAPTCEMVTKKSCQARMASAVMATNVTYLSRWREMLGSPRRHSNGAVEAHAFAVEIGVRDHLERQRGIFRRIAEAGRERHLRTERGLYRVWRCSEKRCVEQARHDRIATDAFLGEVARDHQGHAIDAGLRCRVGRLADLAILCRDRRGVDDRTAFAARQRL